MAEVPSARVIRFYTAQGLLDPPHAHRGRTALYGRKHLLQLVAIKRLQTRGLSLVEVQQRLLGVSPKELARIAGLDREVEPKREPSARSKSFWRAIPEKTEAAPRAPRVEGVALGDGVLLLLEGAEREIDEDDQRAIRVAAAPLLELLRARRLKKGGRDQ